MTTKTQVKFLLKIVATLGVLILLLISLDSRELLNAVRHVNGLWFVIGCLGSFIFVAMRIVKWMVLTRSNGLHANSAQVTRAMLIALALGIVTPARIG